MTDIRVRGAVEKPQECYNPEGQLTLVQSRLYIAHFPEPIFWCFGENPFALRSFLNTHLRRGFRLECGRNFLVKDS